MDISAAKSQALVIRRIANRLMRVGLEQESGYAVDFADHLQTETSYLMDYLDMEDHER